MYFLLARQDQNAVVLRSVPIIVVPGIMGTRLRLTSKKPDDVKIWDPDDELLMYDEWISTSAEDMRIALRHSSVDAEILHEGTSHSPTERARGWAALSHKYYGDLLRSLSRQFEVDDASFRCPVYAFGYDWRQDNTDSAEKLAAFAEQTMQKEGANLVIFVTHSMGGFVVRRALTLQEALAPKTLGVVHIGQPARGAPVAYRRFMYGTDSTFDGYVMRFLIGAAPESTFLLFSALPGAMQLLPSDSRHDKRERSYDVWLRAHRRDEQSPFVLPPGAASVYSMYRSGTHPPGLAEHLRQPEKRLGDTKAEQDAFEESRVDALAGANAAKAFHLALGTKKHDLTWTISSTGVETDDSVIFYFPSKEFEGMRALSIAEPEVIRGRSHLGDGTVPTWSADALLHGPTQDVADGVDPTLQRKFAIGGLVHDTMCADSTTQHTVFEIIRALVHAPKDLLENEIRSNDNELWSRYLTARNPLLPEESRKSAEAELRVAKWFREQGKSVRIMPNPPDAKTPDLDVDGEMIEVKYSKRGTRDRIRSLILDGFFKADRTILVRGTGALLTRAEFDQIQAELAAERPDGDLQIIEEDELPALNF
jgi:hypothetical protein